MGDLEREITTRLETLQSLLPIAENNAEELLQHIRFLRNACSKGSHVQEHIVRHQLLASLLHSTLFTPATGLCDERIELCLWQLLANSIVNNRETQQIVWSEFGELIRLRCVDAKPGKVTDIQLMILYNIFKGGSASIPPLSILQTITALWQKLIDEKSDINLEYLHFFFEYFLVDNRSTVQYYAKLESNERIAFLDYVSNYLRNDSPNGIIGQFLLKHVSKEFKMKSDHILSHTTKDIESLYPREAYSLLTVISMASGREQYSSIYETDHSLFLNVSSLLRCLLAIGKEATNIFTPLNKLEEVALTSKISYDFEKEISFELKTLLVRCVANLIYKNKINKGYCIDTQLIPALLECTNMDARNPLMREWSILAIRNACMDCPEIQEIIANLTNQGLVKNDVVNELNLDLGSLRISST